LTGEDDDCMGIAVFTWSSYVDLLGKARRDLTTLQAKRTSMKMDELFNYVCTTTHIYDWLWKDKQNIPRAARKDAHDLSFDEKKPSMVWVVRQLCNGAKHTRAKVDGKVIKDPGSMLAARPFPSRWVPRRPRPTRLRSRGTGGTLLTCARMPWRSGRTCYGCTACRAGSEGRCSTG
jgi:hypothetical protein